MGASLSLSKHQSNIDHSHHCSSEPSSAVNYPSSSQRIIRHQTHDWGLVALEGRLLNQNKNKGATIIGEIINIANNLRSQFESGIFLELQYVLILNHTLFLVNYIFNIQYLKNQGTLYLGAALLCLASSEPIFVCYCWFSYLFLCDKFSKINTENILGVYQKAKTIWT